MGGGEVEELCDWGLDSDWQVVVLSACRQCQVGREERV